MSEPSTSPSPSQRANGSHHIERPLRRSVSPHSQDESEDEEVAGLVGTSGGSSTSQQARREKGHHFGNDQDDDLDSHVTGNNADNAGSSDSPYDHSIATSSEQGTIFRDRPTHQVLKNHRRKNQRSNLGKVWEISKEALPTLILSLISLMFSGELLVHLARWPVFLKVDKLFILVPILLNLKGNLEMNLSLRMSTSANIGELDIRRTRQTLIKGNMTLLQVQALIVSAAAGILAFVLGYFADGHETRNNVAVPQATSNTTLVPPPVSSSSTSITPRSLVSGISIGAARSFGSALRRSRFLKRSSPAETALEPRRIIHHHPNAPDPALRLRNGYFEFVLVLATGMLSASLSSAILGNFMCALVVVARQTGANPDNIASPLAASLGDLLTLTILGLLGSALVHFEGTILATILLISLLIACGICFMFTLRNTYVRELLSSGWVPLIIAMFISSGAGLVLDTFVLRYQGFALLAPIITGLPGACAAIFVSRTSTALHSGKGEITLNSQRQQQTQNNTMMNSRSSLIYKVKQKLRLSNLTGPAEGWLVPATLLIIGSLIEILSLTFILLSSQMQFSITFFLTFSISSILTILLSLIIAHFFTIQLWKNDYDPDIYCLPFISSVVDVIGQCLLVAAFWIAIILGDTVSAAVNTGA
ncbi:unnamed protein product [Sympodiomycopsis kandeliae]